LLAYARGAGVDTRWVVVEADPDFFEITKRIHNHLHGWAGDGGRLGDAEREIYEETLRNSAARLAPMVRSGDVIFCHDPQTAGLVAPVAAFGATVVWRCHVGLDLPNELAWGAWDFLRPYVEPADAYVFSRREFAWEDLAEEKLWVVATSIDAFSPKNQDLDPTVVDAILARVGLATESDGSAGLPALRWVARTGRRQRRSTKAAPIPADVPMTAQISRWDRLKDPAGVMRGFAENRHDDQAHLLLAGPSVAAVSDDPEGTAVLKEVRDERAALGAAVRDRVHLACLPMDDVEENAANRQRDSATSSDSRAEAFCRRLRPHGRGGDVEEPTRDRQPPRGIQDQVVDGRTGILLDDPENLEAFAGARQEQLDDPDRAARMGQQGREWVIERFLGPRHLIQHPRLLDELLA